MWDIIKRRSSYALPRTIIMSRTNDDDSFFAQERDRLASEITSVRPSTHVPLGGPRGHPFG